MHRPTVYVSTLVFAILQTLFHLCNLTVLDISSRSGKWQYKLDPSWPTDPSVFTGSVYCVAVDDKNGEIYVGQTLFHLCNLTVLDISSRLGKWQYKLDPSWPTDPSVFTGSVYCVAVDDKNGEIYVGQRGTDGHPVIVFGKSGELKRMFTNDSSPISLIHGMRMHYNWTEQTTSVWLTDLGDDLRGHTVKRFSHSGALKTVLGTPNKAGMALTPQYQFDKVADVAISRSGEVYIVDGDGGMNNRLLKLDKDFRLQWCVGTNGTSKGQFRIPHSVELDSYGRVWVADRMNGRLQAFDAQDGKFIGQWTSCFKDGQPYSVRLSGDKSHFIVTQLNQDKILIVGAPQARGDIGECQVYAEIRVANGSKPHLVAVSHSDGALYVAELGSQTCQKFVPVSTKSHLIN